MKNKPNIRSHQCISRLIVLLLIAFCIVASELGTHKASAIQTSETDLIAQANKAIANAQVALELAREKSLDGALRLEELQEFSTFKDPDINALSSLRRLAHTVNLMFDETAEKKTLQDQLLDAQTKLVGAFKKLNESKTALDAATSTPNIETAKSGVNGTIEIVKLSLDATAETAPGLSGLVTKLNQALSAVYVKVAALAKAVDDRVGVFKQNITEPNDLFTLFKNKLADIPALIQFDLDLQESWPNLSAELKKVVTDHDTKAAPVDTAVKNLHASVATVASGINQQIAILAKYAVARDTAAIATTQTLKADPAAHESEAIENIKQSESSAASLEKINSLVDSISAQAEAASIAGFDKTKTQGAQKDLTDKVNHLRLTAATLQELLSGDRSLWITEKIRLYYFTDIPRLVRTLNPAASPIGGDDDARRRAADRLDKLRQAEDAQSEANSKVASLKKSVINLRQELQQANAELNAANILAEKSASRDAELNRRPAADVSAERKALSLEEKNKREKERVAAQQRADKLNDENTGLAADLTKAEAELEVAQEAFERASNATIRAAQAESAAFANARDNAPFWFAPASTISTDPAKRVEITASTGGENAIFIRGRREDVVKVQDIVAKLDEPAPQARLTLWKIELNSDATKEGAERFNKSLEIVEQELASTRAQIAAALSLLLECITEEANAAANSMSQRLADTAHLADLRTDCVEEYLYEQNQFQQDPRVTDVSGRVQRLKRYFLYSPQVRKELGVDFASILGFENPKLFGLKDPASATTLNEGLIVLLLTTRGHRRAILDEFEKRLPDRLQEVTTVAPGDENNRDKRLLKLSRHFARLYSLLNEDPRTAAIDDTEDVSMTRQQEELVYAIRGLLLKHLVPKIIDLQTRVPEFQKLSKARATQQDKLYQCLVQKLPKIFDTIHDEFGISPVDALGQSGDRRTVIVDSPYEETIALQKYRGAAPFGPVRIYNLRPSPARVAAADGMLDVFTKAFEDDVDREFVQPMLRELRERLKKTGIGFGTIQRTSVLATNRMVARVDPRATAELAVGQETNLIQGLQQLSQLTLAAQTGNAMGAIGAFKTLANEKDAAEIFGITSGSAFQVTPIFDPTGQALRFKFDFVDTTLVREPKGTTNPRLPRVERHTVNTEVQLANLEIREVSRFESDSKIGLPTTYRGGLPLLKDIPGIRPVPFIGWFVRRKGSNAIAQRSLIFAQTTMSPTIGDILDLLDTSLQRR